MDLSLDDYITKKNTGFQKTTIRLGPKVSPGRANVAATQKNVVSLQRKNQLQTRQGSGVNYNVVGLGAVKKFDARQKLSQKEKQQPVQDARQKLAQKNKFSSVAPRLQIKTAGAQANRIQAPARTGTSPGRIQLRTGGVAKVPGKIQIRRPITAPGADTNTKLDAQDMRIKIQNAKAKSMDAREKIRARQNAKAAVQQASVTQNKVQTSAQAKVMVTGFGADTFQHTGGGLKKTISSNQFDDPDIDMEQTVDSSRRDMSLKKTIQNSSAIPTVTNRVGNNIVIAPTEQLYREPQPQHQVFQHMQPQQQQQQQHQLHQQPSHYPQVQITQSVQSSYIEPQYGQQQYTSQPQYSQPPQYNQPPPQPAVQSQPQVQERMPMIRIKNDEYRPPQPVSHIPVVKPEPEYVPVVKPDPEFAPSSSYYQREPEPARPVKTTVTRNTQSQPASSRLGGITREEEDIPEMSPLQGYRLMITNLHHVVTQDDIVELFGAVGALRKAKLLRAGTAEVVFIKREEALAAVHKYHNRELDGQPMKVVMSSLGASAPAKTEETSSALRGLPKSSGSQADISGNVDIGLLHKALFKTTSKDEPPTRPVAFTVKI